MYADVPDGDLYNNQINFNDGTLPINYMRGYSPVSAPGVICVGATDITVAERRASFSNVGKRVDIYAPGENIISSVNAQIEDPITTTVITSPAPGQPTYTFTSYPTSVNEGTTVEFTIGTTGVPVDTLLTWKLNFENRGPGYKSIDVTNDVRFYSEPTRIAADGTGKFSVEFIADLWTEGLEVFRVEIRRDVVLTPGTDPVSIPVAITPYITLNDTSTGTQFPKGIDPRNNSFFRDRFDGTSMASPQVAGIIACALETYPNMTAAQALSYIQGYANDGVLYDLPFDSTFGEFYFGLVNRYKLFNGPNKYATYQPNTRPNQVQPAIGHKSRPATGRVYPRTRITRAQ
jgi:subtilisin family serine protease